MQHVISSTCPVQGDTGSHGGSLYCILCRWSIKRVFESWALRLPRVLGAARCSCACSDSHTNLTCLRTFTVCAADLVLACMQITRLAVMASASVLSCLQYDLKSLMPKAGVPSPSWTMSNIGAGMPTGHQSGGSQKSWPSCLSRHPFGS